MQPFQGRASKVEDGQAPQAWLANGEKSPVCRALTAMCHHVSGTKPLTPIWTNGKLLQKTAENQPNGTLEALPFQGRFPAVPISQGALRDPGLCHGTLSGSQTLYMAFSPESFRSTCLQWSRARNKLLRPNRLLRARLLNDAIQTTTA